MRKAILWILLIISPHYVFAQIIFLPEDTGEYAPTVIFNEYYKQYPEVPKAPQLNVSWYKSPEDIGSKIELHNIAHNIRYFKDDGTSYVEKIIDGKKARLFLKETIGHTYIVYDLVYVFYLDDTEGVVNDAVVSPFTKPSNNIFIDTNNNASNASDVSTNNEGEGTNDISDDLKNSIIPFYTLRETGKSIFVDIILQKKDAVSKREVLYRYNKKGEKIYTETYIYTEKGAIQRLNRNFSDGGVQRYVYYFSTGGLKDVYYQDPDGSNYLLVYTLAGNLSEKIIYNTKQFLSYELKNTYDKNNTLIFQVEMDYETMLSTEIAFENERITTQTYYKLIEYIEDEKEQNEESQTGDEKEQNEKLVSENQSPEELENSPNKQTDEQTEKQTNTIPTKKIIADKQLLKTEYYTYNNTGEQIEKQQQNILHETIVSVVEKNGVYIETNKIDGITISKTRTEGDKKIISYFFQDAEILRQYFVNDNKIKEEVINNEKVSEIREY